MNKGSHQDSARLSAMLDKIKVRQTQGLYEELQGIVSNRDFDHKALDAAFRALLDAEGGLIKEVAPLMSFNMTTLTEKHATIKKAAKHTHVVDPDVANIVLAAGIGRASRPNAPRQDQGMIEELQI